MAQNTDNNPAETPADVRQDQRPPKREQLTQYWAFRFTGSKIPKVEELIEAMDVDWIVEYGFQKEKGEKGYKIEHYQGAFEVQPRMRFTPLSEYFGSKFTELEFPTKDYLMYSKSKAAERYAMKRETRIEGPWYKGARFEGIHREVDYVVDIQLRPWQLQIQGRVLNTDTHDREIWWCWEPYGGLGKTTFLKWIYQNYKNVLLISGKAADMKHSVVKYQEEQGRLPELIVINIPKCTNMAYISTTGMEEIKDMFFHSGKYEGGMVCGPPPKMICFANERPPEVESMALDRWRIIRLPDGASKQVKRAREEDWQECENMLMVDQKHNSQDLLV